MSETITLTETITDNPVEFVWRNITHFYKLPHCDGTRIELASRYQIHVDESVLEIKQAIEQAASDE